MFADFSARDVCNKDSRSITEDDRKILLQEVERAFKEGVRHFLVTHGTFTMPETGTYLMENLSDSTVSDVSIVITGAMYPMNLVGGDGLLNLGAAVSALINSNEPLGIVINMHAKNWDPSKIKKDADNLLFHEA